MLEDGIHSLAYGHKDVQQTLEADHHPPGVFDKILTIKEAKRLGLLWERRPRLLRELGYDPAIQQEETEEDAIDAGDAIRGRVAELVNQVPNQPYQFLPNEDREQDPPSSPTTTRKKDHHQPKYRRLQLAADCDQEEAHEVDTSFESSDEEEASAPINSSRRNDGSSRKRKAPRLVDEFFEEEAAEDETQSNSEEEQAETNLESRMDQSLDDSFLGEDEEFESD